MSSGPKAWREDLEEQAWTERVERLKALPTGQLMDIIDAIHDSVICLESTVNSLPRSGWAHLDTIKTQLRKLR